MLQEIFTVSPGRQWPRPGCGLRLQPLPLLNPENQDKMDIAKGKD
jgi:hypothetical protein